MFNNQWTKFKLICEILRRLLSAIIYFLSKKENVATAKTFKHASRALRRKLGRIIRNENLFVSEIEQRTRENICEKCPYRSGKHCKVCNCYIPLKTMFVDEFCPDSKHRW